MPRAAQPTLTHRQSNTIGAYEAKTHFSGLLSRVQTGEEITITKHGAAIARLVPVRKGSSTEERAEAIKRIQKLGRSLSLGTLRIKDLIAEGRK